MAHCKEYGKDNGKLLIFKLLALCKKLKTNSNSNTILSSLNFLHISGICPKNPLLHYASVTPGRSIF